MAGDAHRIAALIKEVEAATTRAPCTASILVSGGEMKFLLKCLAALSVLVAGMGLAGVAWAQAKPNVLTIMLDDLDVSLFETALRNDLLPNIREQIIEKGTTFTESFVSTPLCCPS
ncbi:MAG TPA: hypothetical protein VLA16_23470, partial [Ideonella sp.]|nr:hypothetical protein [Ideonella sp.]